MFTVESNSFTELDQTLSDLAAASVRWRDTSLEDRIDLLRRTVQTVRMQADEWVAVACQAKGISPDSNLAAEEISAGPLATIRYLQLLINTLEALAQNKPLPIVGSLSEDTDGRLLVPVLPARGLFDSIVFRGFTAQVRMQQGIMPANIAEHWGAYYHQAPADRPTGVSLVLGAGNVSSIGPTDALYKIFMDGHAVLLKMNPVNDYLLPVFYQAFAPLFLRQILWIVKADSAISSYIAHHNSINDVHITGSIDTHQAIVWGSNPAERATRIAANDPLLKKPITSELGNVTPWIIIPHKYTARELDFQAENFVTSIVNNASFNCIASKVLITQGQWPQRTDFINLVQEMLQRVPRRLAYYPGAADRFARFAQTDASKVEKNLPWTLIPDVTPQSHPEHFSSESFVCVAVETALDANSPEEFLEKAVDFANDRIEGTLGVTLIVHPQFRKRRGNEQRLRSAIARLRYGTVAINHWSAIGYANMGSPWGGYPGGMLADPKSGIGWVHNTLLLDGIEKTILEGPLTVWPKPAWFCFNRNARALSRQAVELYAKPSVLRLPRLLWSAVTA
ncbi:MAG: aldehyde dehydrogenase family protein [Planctomycetota bacterium]|nr:aldehyde dehydrogenase family protein [Planctomycetota bacterium]